MTDTMKFVTIGHHSCAELIKHRFASLQSKKSSLNSRNCSYHQRNTVSWFSLGFSDCPYSGLYSFKQGLILKCNAYGPSPKQFSSSVSMSRCCSLKTARENGQICRPSMSSPQNDARSKMKHGLNRPPFARAIL